jgi:hypothetical protein
LLFIKWFNLSSFANKTHEIKLNEGAPQERTESNKKSNKFNEEIPTKMIPEAVICAFPAKTLRKLAIFGRNPPENAIRNSSQEYHGTVRFHAGLFDLGIKKCFNNKNENTMNKLMLYHY